MPASSAVQLAQRNAEVGLIDFVDGRCRRTLSELYDSALERVNTITNEATLASCYAKSQTKCIVSGTIMRSASNTAVKRNTGWTAHETPLSVCTFLIPPAGPTGADRMSRLRRILFPVTGQGFF